MVNSEKFSGHACWAVHYGSNHHDVNPLRNRLWGITITMREDISEIRRRTLMPAFGPYLRDLRVGSFITPEQASQFPDKDGAVTGPLNAKNGAVGCAIRAIRSVSWGLGCAALNTALRAHCRSRLPGYSPKPCAIAGDLVIDRHAYVSQSARMPNTSRRVWSSFGGPVRSRIRQRPKSGDVRAISRAVWAHDQVRTGCQIGSDIVSSAHESRKVSRSA